MISKRLKKHKRVNKHPPSIVLVLIIIVVGVALLIYTHAATPTTSIEAESGTVAGGGAGKITGDATASGGRYVKFSTAGTQTLHCITNPHLCGFPDATNTGVPVGTTLTPSGNITVTTNGAVINAMDVRGEITVDANNVTIQNSRITVIASDQWYGINVANDHTGLRVLHSTITTDPAVGFGYAGVWNTNSPASGASIEVGWSDVSRMKDNISGRFFNVHDTYLHDSDPGHAQSLQIVQPGVSTFTNNTFIAPVGSTAALYISCSPCSTSTPDHDVTATNNLMAGGASVVYGGSQGPGTTSNIKINNNHFAHINTEYGPLAYFEFGDPGNEFNGNIWDDDPGPTVGAGYPQAYSAGSTVTGNSFQF